MSAPFLQTHLAWLRLLAWEAGVSFGKLTPSFFVTKVSRLGRFAIVGERMDSGCTVLSEVGSPCFQWVVLSCAYSGSLAQECCR